MRWLMRRCVEGVLMLALVPAGAEAQPVARTFGEVSMFLKPADYAIVVDRDGRESWGRVVEVSPSSLTLALVLRSDGGARLETTGDRPVFTDENIRLIMRSDESGRRGAAVYPASWDTVDVLPADAEVSVLLESGEQRRYRFLQAGADSLRLLAASGQEVAVRKSDIVRVERHGMSDGVGDGIALGTAIGAAACLGMVAIAYATACDTCDAPAPGPLYAAWGTMGAGVGALTGWLADRLHKGKSVVFPAVSPILTARHKGLAVAVRF